MQEFILRQHLLFSNMSRDLHQDTQGMQVLELELTPAVR